LSTTDGCPYGAEYLEPIKKVKPFKYDKDGQYKYEDLSGVEYTKSKGACSSEGVYSRDYPGATGEEAYDYGDYYGGDYLGFTKKKVSFTPSAKAGGHSGYAKKKNKESSSYLDLFDGGSPRKKSSSSYLDSFDGGSPKKKSSTSYGSYGAGGYSGSKKKRRGSFSYLDLL
jgi:hypothetical protein